MARFWVCQWKSVPEDPVDVNYPDFPNSFPRPWGCYKPKTPDRFYVEFAADLDPIEAREMALRGNVKAEEERTFVPRAKRRSDGVVTRKSLDGTTDLPDSNPRLRDG